ncbi:hypothetical protein Dimus_035758 [Dionaea muscipula]
MEIVEELSCEFVQGGELEHQENCNEPHVQREIELNRDVGIRMNKTISSATRQAGGPENLTWIEKDARNHLDKVRRHELQVN